MKEKTKFKIARAIDTVAKVLYFPVYLIGWVLLKVLQMLTALAYAIMLDLPAAIILIQRTFEYDRRK